MFGGFPITVLILLAWLVLEIIRLLFGYIGNLRERVRARAPLLWGRSMWAMRRWLCVVCVGGG